MVEVDICNLALAYLGDTATVASINPPEGSAQAQHCARFYPMALQLMLELHQWNFVTKRAYLAVSATCYFKEWRFAYAYPSDALNVISVLPKCWYPQNLFDRAILAYWSYWPAELEIEQKGDFEIEVVNGQMVILSNAEDAIARYTVSTVQPGMFTALFTDALAWKLASMLAGPLLKGDVGAAESKRCLQAHAIFLGKAREQDANEGHDSRQPLPSSIRARN